MDNKKSLLQDSLQELENIKNESLELAKEQLINESADILEKKSAALFEKLISESEEEESKESEKEDDDSEEELETEPSDEKEEEEGEEEEEEGEEEGEEEEDDEEDINFDDEEEEDEFMSVKVDEKVLKESNLRNKNNMKNNKKEVLKDLRDVSFNKLVEAYYNMDESDSFVVQEEYEEDFIDIEDDPEFERRMSGSKKYKPSSRELSSMTSDDEYDPYADVRKGSDYGDEEMDENYEEDYIDIEDDPEFMQRMSGSKKYKPSSRELKSMSSSDDEYDPYADVRKGSDYGDEEMDEEIMYEIDMPEGYMDEELTDEDINEMLSEMGIEEDMHNVQEVSHMDKTSELEEAFSEMTMEELEEMHRMLEGDDSYMTAEEEVMSEEEEIEEMLSSMQDDEELEESSAITSQTKVNRGNRGGGSVEGRPERRSGMISEEDMEEVAALQERVKKLEAEKSSLQEGFVNKVKLLENKVYDVTISALKAGFVNKFLLEHPLRENEKTEIVYRFANAQTKEQIKETYISLTNEFAKGQTVKDGSMLNESVQNKVGKVHKTDNAIVREKNLISENDESNRFKQLLNYNFGRK
jgi:hypothetical protein